MVISYWRRVFVNDGLLLPEVLHTYVQEQSEPVVIDRSRLARLVSNVVIEHVNLENSAFARHDPERLIHVLFEHEVL